MMVIAIQDPLPENNSVLPTKLIGKLLTSEVTDELGLNLKSLARSQSQQRKWRSQIIKFRKSGIASK